jgi:hypothetical protein
LIAAAGTDEFPQQKKIRKRRPVEASLQLRDPRHKTTQAALIKTGVRLRQPMPRKIKCRNVLPYCIR